MEFKMGNKNNNPTESTSSEQIRQNKKVQVVKRIVKKFKRDMNLDNPNSIEPTKKDDLIVKKRKERIFFNSNYVIISDTNKNHKQTPTKPRNAGPQNGGGSRKGVGAGSVGISKSSVVFGAKDEPKAQNNVELPGKKKKKKGQNKKKNVNLQDAMNSNQTVVANKNDAAGSKNTRRGGGSVGVSKSSVVLGAKDEPKEQNNVELPGKKKKKKKKRRNKKKNVNFQDAMNSNQTVVANNNNASGSKNTGGGGNKAKNKSKSKNKQKQKQNSKYLQDPMLIVETVMAKSKCKDLDLSDKAALRLQQDDAMDLMKNIDYNSGRINMISTDSVTVLPHVFMNMKVNLSPYAITHMEHIYDVSESWHKRAKQERARRREKLRMEARQDVKKEDMNQASKSNNNVNKTNKLDTSQQKLANKTTRQQRRQKATQPNNAQPKDKWKPMSKWQQPKQTQLNDPYVLRWLT